MADAPLFYDSVTPLNRERHRDLKLAVPDKPFGFAAGAHMIPALAEEFGAAARHLPILFLPGASQPSPVFLVGLRPGRNGFVNEDGAWSAGYLPAYLRRYPFIIGEMEGAEPLICLDEGSDRLSREAGRPFFAQDGTDTPLLAEIVKLTGDYLNAAKRTEALMVALQTHDLLRPITIEARPSDPSAGGNTSSAVMHGLLALDEHKLNALPDDQILDLRRQGFLGPLYAHLISLASVDRLRESNPS